MQEDLEWSSFRKTPTEGMKKEAGWKRKARYFKEKVKHLLTQRSTNTLKEP